MEQRDLKRKFNKSTSNHQNSKSSSINSWESSKSRKELENHLGGVKNQTKIEHSSSNPFWMKSDHGKHKIWLKIRNETSSIEQLNKLPMNAIKQLRWPLVVLWPIYRFKSKYSSTRYRCEIVTLIKVKDSRRTLGSIKIRWSAIREPRTRHGIRVLDETPESTSQWATWCDLVCC